MRVDDTVKLAVGEVEADADSVCVVDGDGVPLAETSGVNDAEGLAPKLAVPASDRRCGRTHINTASRAWQHRTCIVSHTQPAPHQWE